MTQSDTAAPAWPDEVVDAVTHIVDHVYNCGCPDGALAISQGILAAIAPPSAAPVVTASAEELATLLREYFSIQRYLYSTFTSRRDTERKRKRLKQVQKLLMEAVDFDQRWHPHMPQILAAKRAALADQAA